MEANDSSQQTIATFTGTLLRREHAVGQKFVQLVFREGDENWLCISSKLINAKLAVGQEYRVEGEFRRAGDRAYIHEPRIAPVRRAAKAGASKAGRTPKGRKRAWIVSASAFASLLLVGGVVFALHGKGSGQQLNATNAAAHAAQTYSADTTADTASQAASTDTPAAPTTDTPAATTTTSTTTATKKTNNIPTTPPSNPVANNPVSTAYCDSPEVIHFNTTTVYDAGQPEGTEVTPGIDGQQTMCYPDSSGVGGSPTNVTPAQTRVITTTVSPAS